ncbi:flagellar hook-basal body complex protein FliE [Paracoccus saliphilus]|uniref:Flagellar hook-basal body complex protein FliE n=1 Tax=Paracoccus saliphilus TaxID=405559 RepID=A0AA45W3I8_9RHOB|nr:flagellar hook-basal body complex protein FliE [Paracoccus saliphilus]WCR02492.1 flagellar hook-basal body complex protein FliE [Paracoccus saliphilus]SIS76398.1 flagellar hook-basal body complex protein FliE [Paracoccus saliphilus]
MVSSLNAASAYSMARPAIAPDQGSPSATVQRIGSAAEEFAQQMQQFDAAATGAMTGGTGTHHLVQTIAEAQLAMETVVTIRNKVVEAYQEILRMPV